MALITGTGMVDFGASPASETHIDVTGLLTIASASIVDAWLVAVPTSDNTLDSHVSEDIRILAGNLVAGVGFTIYAVCRNGSTTGKWSVAWAVLV